MPYDFLIIDTPPLQSYLYGIEIGEEKEDEQEQTGTPIAPLWN